MENKTLLSTANSYLAPLLILIIPIFVASISSNPWSTPKLVVIIVALLISIGIWVFTLLTSKVAISSSSPLRAPLALFIVAIATSIFMTSEGRLEAVIGKGALLIALAVISYMLSLSHISHKTIKWSVWALVISSSIVALHAIMQLTFLHTLDGLPGFMQTRSFTLTGSPLTSITILILGVVATVLLIIKERNYTKRSVAIALTILQSVALVAYIAMSIPGGELAPQLLSYRASWSLMLDSLKFPKSMFSGVGLNNFPYFYTQFKPLYINTTSLWNFVPTTAASELLQLTITTGLFGLITFLLIPIVALLRRGESEYYEKSILTTISIVALILLAFTPASIPILTLLFITYPLITFSEEKESKIASPTHLVISVLLITIMATIGYWSFKVVMAESYMKQAQSALSGGDGKAVYDKHIKAIELLPFISSYRLSYSSVNMSLAANLSQKGDLSDQDKSTIAQLVSQGVREARAATQLHPSDSRAWSNLGGVYRNLINSTEGADQFSNDSYAKAISLDPANAPLRVEYGGLLYQLSDLAKDQATKDQLLGAAIQQFQTAVQLKTDYANAYYNLSKALEKGGNLSGAYTALERAVASLSPESPDLGTATTELAALKSKVESSQKPKEPAPSTPPVESDLSAPSPLPSALPGNPITLPEESPAP